MKNLRPFQIGMIALFAVLGVSSVIILSKFNVIGSSTVNPYGESVEIWGSFDQKAFTNAFNTIADDDEDFRVVTYRYVDSRDFEDELINAIADGQSPDMVLIPHELLVSLRTKLRPLSYETVTERYFKDTYLDGATVFARSDASYAVPFAVDPFVMYWNNDIFAASGLTAPPATWEELVAHTVPSVTKTDTSRNILQSAVAFGEYGNVNYAKEILIMLITQSGSKLVQEANNEYSVLLDTPIVSKALPPMTAAVQFFIGFSNANSPLYSWNRSQQDDLVAFLGGDLALYFGYGSDVSRIQAQNPNFNFDVAIVPQGASASTKRTYGRFYGLALLNASDNLGGSFAAAQILTSQPYIDTLTQNLLLAPVHRTSIAKGTRDPYQQVIFNSALIARGWLDPDSAGSDAVLKDMIEDIVSNREKIGTAVSDAIGKIKLLF